jgi:tripartite-type tricarboxylate transporter receptor subunit TctC
MTHIPRRREWLMAGSLAAVCAAVPSLAQAQADYPSKPIRMVVPFAPGGGTDTLARVIGERLTATMGQPVVIDNKPGAAGNIGTDAVAKAAPDGYTVALALTGSLLTNQFLFGKLPYQPTRDLALVYQVALGPLVLVVHPSIPAKTAPELMRYLAANKGKVAYGSYGQGSYPHLAGAYMSKKLNADMSHVAYRGEAPMIQDLLGGQIQMAFTTALQAKGHAETGKLRMLGVAGERRFGALPDVPTLAEQGLKDDAYRIAGWLAVVAPANTPAPVVQRLSDEIRKAAQLPEVEQRVSGMGFELIKDSSPKAFAEAYQKDLPIWENLVKSADVKLD